MRHGIQLSQNEMSYVSPGYLPRLNALQVGQGPVSLRSRSVRKESGADDHPFKLCIPYQCLLDLLVFVYSLQQNRVDDLIVEESAMSLAVAGTDPGYAYQLTD